MNNGDQFKPSEIDDDIEDLSTATVKRNVELENRVSELEVELSVWKQAHSVALEASERETKAHNVQVTTLNRQISNLDCFRNQNPLILCIVNGDENVFIRDLLVQGQQGGRAAAQQLTKSIAEYLSNEDVHVFGRLSFWITVYYNKVQWDDLLRSNKICTSEQFEGFLSGFSQSSPRFLMVDVGYYKDTTDSKIKEYLQTYTRFPQTLRIFFCGVHCPYGENCCWGHTCPNGPKCFHLSKGKCWFKGGKLVKCLS
ncbi:hypothetical protein J132_09471 [Termitomyces sp. J132]|nr:hypothetical protein J132_09471 [Termitomyces sp. J132]